MHTHAIDPGTFRAVSRTLVTSESTSPAEFKARVDCLRGEIERDWLGLPEARRKALYSLAMQLEAPPSRFGAWLDSLVGGLERLFRREPDEALIEVARSLMRLSGAVLDAVERVSPEYRNIVTEPLRNALGSTGKGASMTS